MGLDSNNIVNTIIFLKLRKERRDALKANEDMYLNRLALSYNASDFSFLEEGFVNANTTKFYNDLSDFSFNANSLLFDVAHKTWDESISTNDDLLFNRLEDILDNLSIPFHDDPIDNAFFLSDYFGQILKENPTYQDYYSNWKALKSIKENFGEDSLSYKGLVNEWSKDNNKVIVEQEILDYVIKEIKRVHKERADLKNKIDDNRKTPMVDGLETEIISTIFNPKNFCTSDSEWTHCTLAKAEISELLDTNAKEFDFNKGFQHQIETIDFEFCLLKIFRNWFQEAFLESPLWVHSQKISTYPSQMIFARRVSYSQKNTEGFENMKFAQLFKRPNTLKTLKTLKVSGVNQSYLSRNTARKMKVMKAVKSPKTPKAKISSKAVEHAAKTLQPKFMMHRFKIVQPITFPCSVALYSDKNAPILNAKLKVFQNGKEVKQKIKDNKNTYQFGIVSNKSNSVRIVHPEFFDKTVPIKLTRKHLRLKKYHTKIVLSAKEKTINAMNADELLLIGCVGKSLSKDNQPIAGIKYH